MTTIIGIKADKGKKSTRGVILGSDMAATHEEWKPMGDVAYRQETKIGVQKIKVSKDGYFALGMAGRYDQTYHEFLQALLEGEYDLPRIFGDKKFPEFKNMNISRWGRTNPGLEQANSVVIASRFDDIPRLYKIEPWGDVEDYDGVAIGSGSKYVHDYWKVMQPELPNVTINKAINLMDISLSHGNRDMHSTGFDFAVIQPNAIRQYTKEIRRAYEKARKEILKNAKNGSG